VQFDLCATAACATTTPLGSGPVQADGKATYTTSTLTPATYFVRATYLGDGSNFTGSTSSTLSHVVSYTSCITTTVGGGLTIGAGEWVCITATGKVNGDVVVRSDANLAVLGGTVNGNLIVQAGGGLTVGGGTITAIASTGAKTLRICGAALRGDLTASATTSFVLIGDAGDDGSPACTKNTIAGNLNVTNNTAGFELGGNAITKNVTVTGNTGAGPTPARAVPEIEANVIKGSLSCSGNVPAPVNGGRPNTVKGTRSGQCSGASF
jgi:5'-nucleotidase